MYSPIIFGLFGLIIGSFLNVLILRWKERPLTGRSSCASCNETIAWYDLVPVLSWIILRGRCRTCSVSISMQYPLVEASTAIVFFLIAPSPLPLVSHILALPIAALLIAIFVYDLRHTIIPDPWVFALAGLSLFASLLSLTTFELFEQLAWVLISGPLTALPLFFLWFVSRGKWMGFGDVKLALAMGFLLGPLYGFFAVMGGFILGASVSIPLLFFSSSAWRKLSPRFTPTHTSPRVSSAYTMKSEIPFGPFLIGATFIVWLSNMHGIDLLRLLQLQ